MDELLHPSDETSRAGGALTDHFSAAASAAREKGRCGRSILRPPRKGGSLLAAPQPHLSAGFPGRLGGHRVGAVVSTQYAPAYAVSWTAVNVGTVKNKLVLKASSTPPSCGPPASSVTITASTSPSPIRWPWCLGRFSNVADLETSVLSQLGEVMQSYVLTSTRHHRGRRRQLLRPSERPRPGGRPLSHRQHHRARLCGRREHRDGVYLLRDHPDASQMLAASPPTPPPDHLRRGGRRHLRGHRPGQRHDLLRAPGLNPGVDINKIYIGQVLTVKETVPSCPSIPSTRLLQPGHRQPRGIRGDSSMYVGKPRLSPRAPRAPRAYRRRHLRQRPGVQARGAQRDRRHRGHRHRHRQGHQGKAQDRGHRSFIYPVSASPCPPATATAPSSAPTPSIPASIWPALRHLHQGLRRRHRHLRRVQRELRLPGQDRPRQRLRLLLRTLFLPVVSAGDKVYQGQVIAKVGSTAAPPATTATSAPAQRQHRQPPQYL